MGQIVHGFARTTPKHPWTNGQVERMNRTLKEATVKRYHYGTHDQLKEHVQTFLMAYHFAKRLKILSGLTPYEYICNIWTSDPDRFKFDPAGLDTCGSRQERTHNPLICLLYAMHYASRCSQKGEKGVDFYPSATAYNVPL